MHTVAIVGRPNVGKSLLFNRLAGRAVSLVHDQPGVTRDRVTAAVRIGGVPATLIDTGGIGLGDAVDLGAEIEAEAALAIAAAGVIVWVVDGREGRAPLDSVLERKLRRAGKPVIIAANKIDEASQLHRTGEFHNLGFEAFPVSAAHGTGFAAFASAIAARLSELPPEDAPVPPGQTRPIRVAFVGRPNVGKSSLLNAVLGETRVIVSAIAGTTRDEIEVPLPARPGAAARAFLLVDTAGMRRRTRIETALERATTGRTAHAIRRADLCILLLDAADGVTRQDKKIAGLIAAGHKPAIVAINKWDLAQAGQAAVIPAAAAKRGNLKDAFARHVRDGLFFLPHAPVIFTTATEGRGLDDLFAAIERLDAALSQRIPTGPLNRLLQLAQQTQPPPERNRRRFRILYATAPPAEQPFEPPRIVGFCNDPALVSPDWLHFLENRIRAEFKLPGVPLRWEWKGRGAPEKNSAASRAGRARFQT